MDPIAAARARASNRRKKMLILPELQVKVVLIVLLIVLPMLLLNFILVFGDFWWHGGTNDAATYALARSISWSIFRSFGISLVIAIPFCIAAGIALSFRFGGPLYRFHCFLRDARDGRWDVVCTLRRGDNLGFLRDDINGAIGAMSERVHQQRALLGEVHALLAARDFSDVERIKALEAAIAADSALTARHYPAQAGPPAVSANAPAREGIHA